MPELRPFRAIRFAATDLTPLLAPPYDVIDDIGRRELTALSPHNIVRLILPEAGTGRDRYAAAAALLEEWLASGVLRQDEEEAYYLLEQEFEHEGRRFRRYQVLGALRLSPFEEGRVLPHEYTLRTPKEDRLNLIQATGANLSPIFGIFPDDDGKLLSWCKEAAASNQEAASGRTPDGTLNILRRIRTPALVSELARITAPATFFIADGHHRYETALAYAARAGVQDHPGHPAGFILAAAASMRDPGMLVLPTHRVLHGTGQAGELLKRLEEWFQVQEVEREEVGRLAAERQGRQPGVMGYVGRKGFFRLTYRQGALPEAEAPGKPLSYRRLDVAILHRALERFLGIDADNLARKRNVNFVRPWQKAVEAVRNGAECAFILRPPLMEEIHAVARDGCRLPQKSTYFHPKIPSGLLMRRVR